MCINSVSTTPLIHNLEITARSLGALAHVTIAAMVVILFLAIANVTSIYPFIGLLGGTFILVSIEYDIVKFQSAKAISQGIDLVEAYGKDCAHNQFVEPVLAKIENRKPISVRL